MSGLDVGLAAHSMVRGDGEGRVMLELAKALLERGHRVTVYSHRVDDALAARCTVHHVPEVRSVRAVDDLVSTVAGTLATRGGGHDVVVSKGQWVQPTGCHVYYASFSHRGWRLSWDAESRPGVYHRAHARTAEWTERRALRRASAVIACSELVARDLDVPPRTPLHVVPNGVDLDEFAPVSADERAGVRAALGIPGDRYVVGFVGEYRTSRKGLPTLVAALADGDEHLVVAGEGDRGLLDPLRGRAHPLGFADPRRVYAAADVVVVASHYEPFSLVAVEAAASGVPVIATEAVGAAAHLGDAVRTVPVGSAEAIRRALVASRTSDQPAARAHARAAAELLAWSRTAGAAAASVEATALECRSRRA